jgi:predicted permease
MDGLWQDMRYAARKLVRQPGFTVAALLTLALGIGANALLFTLINALLLRPPAGVTTPEKLVSVYTSDYSSGDFGTTSYPDYEDFAKVTDVFQDVAAFSPMPILTGEADAPVRAGAHLVSESYFRTLGVSLNGRSFSAAEATTGAPVAVISRNFWQQQMGSATDAIGRTIKVNGNPVTVIGITPEGFRGSIRGFAADVFMPLRSGVALDLAEMSFTSRGDRGLMVVARLKPGVNMNVASQRMRVVAAQLFQEHPTEWNRLRGDGRPITLLSEKASRIPSQIRSQAYILGAMLAVIVSLVLMICCANVAGLMIARATGLTREMGIRISIGASRARIARLMFVESAVLAIAAAALGLFGTMWLTDMITRLLPRLPVPITLDFGMDGRVVMFTGFVAMFAAILFGSAPAWRASRADPGMVIKVGTGFIGKGRSRISFRSALVTVQVAASVVLLVTALLLLRGMRSALNADLGFNIDNVGLLSLEPEPGFKPDDAAALQTATAAMQALRAMPGVKSVSFANDPPLGMSPSRRGTTVEGYTPAKGEDREYHFGMVGPGYLTTLGIQIVRGRDLSEQDRQGSPAVVVVNERFANKFWKGGDAIGKRISFDGEHFMTIVGVARDAHLVSIGNGEILPYMFIPMLQNGWWGTTLHVRTGNKLTAAELTAMHDAVQRVTPRWTVRGEHTLLEQAGMSILPQRIASIALTVFGGLALVLASIGLYGVIAYAVAQRTHEFGIRFALGATGRDVLGLMLGQGLRVILVGAVIGVALTAAAAQLLRSMLLGLSPLDPVSFIAAPLLLVAIGVMATLLPARRAARIDPLKALRSE